MTTENLPTSSSVPGLPPLSHSSAAAVAEILVDDRLGCLAPIGFAAIVLGGFIAVTYPETGVGVWNAWAYTGAIVLSGVGFVVVPMLVGRLRAESKLKSLGLSPQEIHQVRLLTVAVRAQAGGRPREEARAALIETLLKAGER